jgi:hypothetical protein
MNSSLIVQVADAVVAELNSSPLASDPGFKAVRHYRPVFEMAELKTLRVSVVPLGITIEPQDRSQNAHDIAIDVAVQQRVQAGDNEALDQLMNLVQSVAETLRLRRLSTMQQAMWVKTENVPIYSPDHLETKGAFTSVLTVTFRVVQ